MKDIIFQIMDWYRRYYADGFFLTIAIASYIYLFAYEESLRKKFLYPIGLLAFCILNPLLYWLVFQRVIYWRLFWVIPDAVIIACASVKLLQHVRKRWEKAVLLLLICGVVLVKGTNVYRNAGFSFAENWEKVSKPVEKVCDMILEQKKNPRCILPLPLICEARQYSGEIQLMYGRNVQWYISIPSAEQVAVYEEMESEQPDFSFILSQASELDYDFVVTYEKNVISDTLLDQYHYCELGAVEGYRIYYLKDM